MRYEKHVAWKVTFRDRADDRVGFREFTFADSAKIGEIIARTATRLLVEDRKALEYGLRNRVGIVTLTLTAEQY